MTFTDSANDISKAVLERLGFQVILPSRIHWTRPLRPASHFAHMVSRGIGGKSGDAPRLLSRPLTGLLDNWMGARLIPLSPPLNVLHQEELDLETLLDCIQRFSTRGALQPVYCEESLQWLVAYMQRNRRRGDLHKALLRDSKKSVAGWYVYSCHRGGIGEVVQVGSVNGFAADVIRALLRDAIQQEAVAVHGLAQSETKIVQMLLPAEFPERLKAQGVTGTA